MNDWKNHLEKNPIQKNEKTSKNQSQIAACEHKTTSEKVNLCSNAVFSLCFKIGVKIELLAFSLNFLFRCDQNHYSNLTLNIMKMCEQIFKKLSRTSSDVQFKKIS